MGRIKYYDPNGEKAFLSRMTTAHGDFVSMAELCRILGYKSKEPVRIWLKDNEVPEFLIGNRKRYETAVIAEKLWEART